MLAGLTNFEIHKYYRNESRLNGVYSRHIWPKIKDGSYVINFDEHKAIGTHWIALYRSTYFDQIYFDSFGVEKFPIKIKKFISNKNNIKTLMKR